MSLIDIEAHTPLLGERSASTSGSVGASESEAPVIPRHSGLVSREPPVLGGATLSQGLDTRAKPKEIKHKSVTHLHLTDPVRQFSRWYFSLKSFLITEDPVFGKLLDGERGDHLYYYEWELSRLITFLVKDVDAQYTVGGCVRRHQSTPGSAALEGLADAY